jgi:hypothetical protein
MMKGETMTTTNAIRRSLRPGWLAPLAALGVAVAPHAAWADNLLLAQSTLVTGTESTVDSFTTTGAGKVTIRLQSLDWPAPLSALSFSATSADSVLAYWNGGGSIDSGEMTFNVSGPGTYFTHIMASSTPSSNGIDAGLYSVYMTFQSAVPLPASGWMLLTGMFVLAGIVRAARPLELMGTARA